MCQARGLEESMKRRDVVAMGMAIAVTGVMTFMVGTDDVVWQQDLGPDTAQRAASMTVFNPDQAFAMKGLAIVS